MFTSDAVMMQMEDDEIEAEAADEQEDSSGPRKKVVIFSFSVFTEKMGICSGALMD